MAEIQAATTYQRPLSLEHIEALKVSVVTLLEKTKTHLSNLATTVYVLIRAQKLGMYW